MCRREDAWCVMGFHSLSLFSQQTGKVCFPVHVCAASSEVWRLFSASNSSRAAGFNQDITHIHLKALRPQNGWC